jgi:hypothetical protein
VSDFRVTRTRIVPVTTYRREVDVLYDGDDWFEAEEAHHNAVMSRIETGHIHSQGRHPSHQVENGRCVVCHAPDNTCFKIHAPCGYDMGDLCIASVMERERAEREGNTQ